jgi:hypothetical protein
MADNQLVYRSVKSDLFDIPAEGTKPDWETPTTSPLSSGAAIYQRAVK